MTESEIAKLTVRDIMHREVVTVTPDTSVPELLRVLFDKEITGAPVVEDDEVVGVVSAFDLARVPAYPGGGRLKVRDIMTPSTFSVRPEATLPELARFLVRTGTHRALVLQGGRPLGIVTTFDIVRIVAELEPEAS